MANWICPDCGTTYDYPDGIRILAIVPGWDYCPKDGRVSQRHRFTMKCNTCGFEWTKEDENYKLVSADNICPHCKGESVLTTKIEIVETLVGHMQEVTPEVREALFGTPAKKFYSWRWRLICWLSRHGLWR